MPINMASVASVRRTTQRRNERRETREMFGAAMGEFAHEGEFASAAASAAVSGHFELEAAGATDERGELVVELRARVGGRDG